MSESRPPSFARLFLDSRLWSSIKLIGSLLLVGSAGFYVLGRLHYVGVLTPHISVHWSMLDCVYMTVITVSTIGYGEVLPLPPGVSYHELHAVRAFTLILILTAMGLVGYSVSSATAFFVDGELKSLLSLRSAMKRIANMHGHYIICGCGVTGRVIADELLATGHEVVLIDGEERNLEDFEDQPHAVVISGDATEDEVLEQAGVARALGLAAALPADKDNLYLIITARQTNPGLRIISAASSKQVEQKLRRAGADGVVSSSMIGGLRIASELMRPAVVSFLDLMLRGRESPVRFAQVEVGPAFAGKSLREIQIHARTGLPVLAIREPGAEAFVFNPGDDHRLRDGATLVTMGETQRVQQLVSLIGDADHDAEFITAPEPEPVLDASADDPAERAESPVE